MLLVLPSSCQIFCCIPVNIFHALYSILSSSFFPLLCCFLSNACILRPWAIFCVLLLSICSLPLQYCAVILSNVLLWSHQYSVCPVILPWSYPIFPHKVSLSNIQSPPCQIDVFWSQGQFVCHQSNILQSSCPVFFSYAVRYSVVILSNIMYSSSFPYSIVACLIHVFWSLMQFLFQPSVH
jgi:hypothetical protein